MVAYKILLFIVTRVSSVRTHARIGKRRYLKRLARSVIVIIIITTYYTIELAAVLVARRV